MASYDFEFYETGTISVTAGQTAFTGSGTAWQLRGVEGALVTVSGAGATAFVFALSTDSQGEFRRAWSGPTLVDAQYTMWLPSAVAATALGNHQRLAEIIASIQMAQPSSVILSALAALVGEEGHLPIFTSPTTAGLLPKSELATAAEIAKRVRVDAPQEFTPEEIMQALTNIGALAVDGKAADSSLLDGKTPAQLPTSTATQAALNAKAQLSGGNAFAGVQRFTNDINCRVGSWGTEVALLNMGWSTEGRSWSVAQQPNEDLAFLKFDLSSGVYYSTSITIQKTGLVVHGC